MYFTRTVDMTLYMYYYDTHTHTHAHTHTCSHTLTHAHTNIRTHARTHTYTRIHTHKHTCTQNYMAGQPPHPPAGRPAPSSTSSSQQTTPHTATPHHHDGLQEIRWQLNLFTLCYHSGLINAFLAVWYRNSLWRWGELRHHSCIPRHHSMYACTGQTEQEGTP